MEKRTIIEIHALETTAAANLNRDDTGSPKTEEYGGVTRARVSSQAWKRAMRLMFPELLDPKDLGIRTKKIADILSKRIVGMEPTLEQDARDLAEMVLGKNGAGIPFVAPRKKKNADESNANFNEAQYLMFIGNRQYDKLAEIAIEARQQSEDLNSTATAINSKKKQIKQIIADDKAIDIALFGRMVADVTDLNIDATAQVAHAISVQAVNAESDFYTAVDDAKSSIQSIENETVDSGAAMLGQVEFNAATFYRYANVDANRLFDSLGDVDATAKAIGAFIRAFVTSMPQGKGNSFAQGTLPDLVVVNIRDTQAVNMVGAFERPVNPDYVENATKAFVKRSQSIDEAYGITPVQTWVIRIGDDTKAAEDLAPSCSLSELLNGVEHIVAERLTQE